jgi:hypothetical protein
VFDDGALWRAQIAPLLGADAKLAEARVLIEEAMRRNPF